MQATGTTQHRRARGRPVLVALLGALLLAGLFPAATLGVAEILETGEGFSSVDRREGAVAPTSAQKAIVSQLGASVRWNRYGTPSSLIRYGGYIARGLSGASAPDAARSWINANKGLFRLTSVTDGSLQLASDNPMAGGAGHAVVFRQRFGTLPAGKDGLITVGITGSRASGWRIAYVSSSAAGTQAAPAPATLNATQAWIAAAKDVGRTVASSDIANAGQDGRWTMFRVKGFSHPQRSRLVAVPQPGKQVRSAYETIVLDVSGGRSLAYTHFIDARTGKVLVRESQTLHLAQDAPVRDAQVFAAPATSTYEGQFGPGLNCGPFEGPYTAPDGTQSIVATATSPGNDIILELYQGDKVNRVATSDIPLGPNPEVLTYEPDAGVAPGDYYVRVCPFSGTEPAPPLYAGNITFNDASGTDVAYPPRWRFFLANPRLDLSDVDTRILACWQDPPGPPDFPNADCQRELINLASRGTWDYDPTFNRPSFTTKGNNANSAESWFSPFTPGEQYRPVRSNRRYDAAWDDEWQNAQCNQSVFGPDVDPLEEGTQPAAVEGGNDIDAAIINLFSQHNRMHDFSYFLGFTEDNFNLQQSNFGGPGEDGDPETGNAQAGAVDGGFPDYLGRDNANQITFGDGIPGITNMYLWQPISAAFYAPCVDGDYDMSVIAHEYTHAISTRMVAGADGGISSPQGGAMGESWSDLTAVEYLNALDFVPTGGENPFTVGAYVTGNRVTGIRNYNMSNSPLNYSDIGYDFVCNAALIGPPLETFCEDGRTQVHADGEIWSATNFDIRKALIAKYNGTYPASNDGLQRRCAEGTELQTPKPAQLCPGNRRWIQILFDAYLLLQSDLSMLDARDAYLASDVMRFGGANQKELWRAFAKRGMGPRASDCRPNDDPDTEDVVEPDICDGATIDGAADFSTPVQTNEGRLGFRARAIDKAGAPLLRNARIYVGRYEAGAVPIADTDPSTPLGNQALFVPGTYDFVVQANGFGLQRVRHTVQPGADPLQLIVVDMPTNWASRYTDPDGDGDVDGDDEAVANSPEMGSVNENKLIDDTEATNWAVLNRAPNIQGSTITVDLAGSKPVLVGNVRVSAFLRPRDENDPGDPAENEDPSEPVGDTESQSRFSALRSFRIETCSVGAGSDCVLTGFTPVATFMDAFPAGAPRPIAPNLQFKDFNVADSMATHVRLVALDNQCTGGPAYQDPTPGTVEPDHDDDPLNQTDCDESVLDAAPATNQGRFLRAAELQVLSHPGSTSVRRDPVVALSMIGPATAKQDTNVSYTIAYTNLGPAPSSDARIVATLPAGLAFRASAGATYDSATRKVTWNVGTVPVGASGTVTLNGRVTAAPPTTLLTTAEFIAPLTVAPPAAAATLVVP